MEDGKKEEEATTKLQQWQRQRELLNQMRTKKFSRIDNPTLQLVLAANAAASDDSTKKVRDWGLLMNIARINRGLPAPAWNS